MRTEPPVRLQAEAEPDPVLTDALAALRDDQADQARIARVAERLGPLLDAPPPTLPPSLAGALGKSLGLKLTVSAAVALVATAWIMLWGPQPIPAAPPAQIPSERAERAAKPAAAEPAQVASDPSASDGNLHPEHVPEGAALPKPPDDDRLEPRHATEAEPPGPRPSSKAMGHSPGASKRSARPGPRAERGRPKAAPRARSEAEPPDGARRGVRNVQPAESRDTTPAARHDQEQSADDSPPPPPAPPGEADLLLAARRALARDAKEALRLLDDHAARFPRGMLAPEREVLAIEALHALGRTEEARQRLTRLRSEYPDSPYLQSLD